MTRDEMKDRISMALKDPVLQQGFEIICKENAELKCCGNCKYFDFNEPNYCHKGVYRERQYVCSKWEFGN